MKWLIVIAILFLLCIPLVMVAESPVTMTGNFSFTGITGFTKETSGHAYPDFKINLNAKFDEFNSGYFRLRGYEGRQSWTSQKAYITSNLGGILGWENGLSAQFGFTDMDPKGFPAPTYSFHESVSTLGSTEGAGVFVYGNYGKHFNYQLNQTFTATNMNTLVSLQPYIFEIAYSRLFTDDKGFIQVSATPKIGPVSIGVGYGYQLMQNTDHFGIGYKIPVTKKLDTGGTFYHNFNFDTDATVNKLAFDVNYVEEKWGTNNVIAFGLGDTVFGGVEISAYKVLGKMTKLYCGYLYIPKDSWWAGNISGTAGPEHTGGFFFKASTGL